MEIGSNHITLFISVISLVVMLILAWRDRPRLMVSSEASKDEGGDYIWFTVRATNKGRRPITLLTLVGIYSNGEHQGFYLSEKGIKIDEGGFYEIEVGERIDVLYTTSVDDFSDITLKDVYFESACGKKINIKNAKHNIAKLNL